MPTISNVEPVVARAAISVAISAFVKALVIFGVLTFTSEQLAALLLSVDSALALWYVITTRSRVTPVVDPVLSADTYVTTPEGNEAVVVETHPA